jgi:ribosome recycling factor
MTLEDFKKQGNELIGRLKTAMTGIRAGRATVGLVENLTIDYYGQKIPLKQIASLTVVPPREIRIQPWEKESASTIAKAVETANLGLSLSVDNNIIKAYLPELSLERRNELIKHVKKEVEQFRIELRHLRDLANKKIQNDFDAKIISEDAKFKAKEKVQKETDAFNDEIESILENKIKEISQ